MTVNNTTTHFVPPPFLARLGVTTRLNFRVAIGVRRWWLLLKLLIHLHVHLLLILVILQLPLAARSMLTVAPAQVQE